LDWVNFREDGTIINYGIKNDVEINGIIDKKATRLFYVNNGRLLK